MSYITRLIDGDSRSCIAIYDCPPDHEILPCIKEHTKDVCQPCLSGWVRPYNVSSNIDTEQTKCFKNRNRNKCRPKDLVPSRSRGIGRCSWAEYCECNKYDCYYAQNGNSCICLKTNGCDVGKTLHSNGTCIACPPGTWKTNRGCGPCLHVKLTTTQQTTIKTTPQHTTTKTTLQHTSTGKTQNVVTTLNNRFSKGTTHVNINATQSRQHSRIVNGKASDASVPSTDVTNAIPYIAIPITCFALILLLLFLVWKRRKRSSAAPVTTTGGDLEIPARVRTESTEDRNFPENTEGPDNRHDVVDETWRLDHETDGLLHMADNTAGQSNANNSETKHDTGNSTNSNLKTLPDLITAICNEESEHAKSLPPGLSQTGHLANIVRPIRTSVSEHTLTSENNSKLVTKAIKPRSNVILDNERKDEIENSCLTTETVHSVSHGSPALPHLDLLTPDENQIGSHVTEVSIEQLTEHQSKPVRQVSETDTLSDGPASSGFFSGGAMSNNGSFLQAYGNLVSESDRNTDDTSTIISDLDNYNFNLAGQKPPPPCTGSRSAIDFQDKALQNIPFHDLHKDSFD